MANYQNLLDSIANVITTNNNNEITGAIMKSTLQSIVSVMGAGATFGGVAHPADNPGTPDGSVVYIASEAGTYTNFGSLTLSANELAVLMWNSSAWSKSTIVTVNPVLLPPNSASDGYPNDLSFCDDNGNMIVEFKNGDVRTKNFDSAENAISTAEKTKLAGIENGAEVNDINSSDTVYADLEFSDENGNMIMSLRDGHIRTKNFNSQNISTPKNYTGRDISTFAKIMCVGDSLTEGAFNYLSGGSFGNNTTASALGRPYSYPQYLAKITGCEVTNLGRSGLTSTQWYDYYTTGAGSSTDFSGYDCAIIQLGVNDDSSTLETTTTTALNNIISKIKTANNNIKIFLAGIINSKSYPCASSGENYYTKDQYLRSYYQANYASDTQVYFVDHVAYGHLRDKPNAQHGGSYPVDNYNEGHLSAYGYWRLAQDYVSIISYIMGTDEIGNFRKIQFIGTSYTCY